MTPRSARNNNPGNLNAGGAWQGLMPRERMNDAQKAEPRFAVFATPEWGFRALCKVLLSYQHIHGLHTVNQMISRWAPPSENPTNNYVAHVCRDLNVKPDDLIDLNDEHILWKFAKSISTEEAGGFFYTDAQVQTGAHMALT